MPTTRELLDKIQGFKKALADVQTSTIITGSDPYTNGHWTTKRKLANTLFRLGERYAQLGNYFEAVKMFYEAFLQTGMEAANSQLNLEFRDDEVEPSVVTEKPLDEKDLLPPNATAEEWFIMGLQLQSGLGQRMNWSLAYAYYNAAALRGSIAALIQQGTMLLLGQGTTKNLDQAKTCFEKAAEQVDPTNAWAHLGLFHIFKQKGQYQEAYDQLLLAENSGNAIAAGILGDMYYHRGFLNEGFLQHLNIKCDQSQANHWLRVAGLQGNGRACYQIACIYDLEGDTKSLAECVKWFAFAVKYGYVSELIPSGKWTRFPADYLGNYVAEWVDRALSGSEEYKNLIGSTIESLQYLVDRSDSWLSGGDLGRIYEYGLGVPVNPVLALRWYVHNATHNNCRFESLVYLAKIYEKGGLDVDISYDQALQWWRLAHDRKGELNNDDYDTGFRLARLYRSPHAPTTPDQALLYRRHVLEFYPPDKRSALSALEKCATNNPGDFDCRYHYTIACIATDNLPSDANFNEYANRRFMELYESNKVLVTEAIENDDLLTLEDKIGLYETLYRECSQSETVDSLKNDIRNSLAQLRRQLADELISEAKKNLQLEGSYLEELTKAPVTSQPASTLVISNKRKFEALAAASHSFGDNSSSTFFDRKAEEPPTSDATENSTADADDDVEDKRVAEPS